MTGQQPIQGLFHEYLLWLVNANHDSKNKGRKLPLICELANANDGYIIACHRGDVKGNLDFFKASWLPGEEGRATIASDKVITSRPLAAKMEKRNCLLYTSSTS